MKSARVAPGKANMQAENTINPRVRLIAVNSHIGQRDRAWRGVRLDES
jgi:hypothetical protein